MKFFFSETAHDYKSYYFPYQVWLLKEKDDDLAKIYESGFLPFRNKSNLFYLSRSCRVDLKNFSLSSENRRAIKKTGDFNFKIEKLANFDYQPRVQKLCKDWARTCRWRISTKSLKYLFGGQYFNYIFVWKKDDEEIGFQIIFQNSKLAHTGHVFYDANKAGKNLGMRMLIEASLWAKKEGKNYNYLGTCYDKGRYKWNFNSLEFFNGFEWSLNDKEWKYLGQRTSENYLLREKAYLKEFTKTANIEEILSSKGISFKLK
ncbi:MAG: hypothetical protein ABIB61_02585 [Candidatus Shapirobacteria bacterium]